MIKELEKAYVVKLIFNNMEYYLVSLSGSISRLMEDAIVFASIGDIHSFIGKVEVYWERILFEKPFSWKIEETYHHPFRFSPGSMTTV